MKKFEAVSGDQGLFDLVGASDDDLFVVKLENVKSIVAMHKVSPDFTVIAERKAIEKYVPKVGDDVAVLIFKINVIAIDHCGFVWGITNNKEVLSFEGDCEFTKIDRSHNPVNMVKSEKEVNWRLKNGCHFKVDGVTYRDAILFDDGTVGGFTGVGDDVVGKLFEHSTIFYKP